MFEKFAARARNSGIDYQLLLPLLVSTALVQLLTSLVRVTTSYRAVELKLSIIWLGLIASAFAIGSAVVPQELIGALERAFPGVKVKESYGLTEGGGGG